MRKKLIISNWKDNISTPAQAEGLLESINGYLDARGEGVEFSLVFCPTLKLVEDISGLLKEGHLEHEAELGVQDIELGDDVKFSGAVLNKLGVRYVIVGHSDRRWKMGESDETVNRKLKTVLANEMIPIVCIGERERDPSTDSGQVCKNFLEKQIQATFTGLSADDISKCVIAYEPVWAISTTPGARPDKPEDTLEIFKFIKNTLIGNLPEVLYGGSITSANAADFLNHDEINGLLIGSASVNKGEFISILSKL
ncbi:MAG: hypothetical protein A2750_01890 [Candidatus Yanofskybacteria bacterium RIFCSPHIGHO2_01_FULL_45_42]|uniref:Triosephosphate isomerase n=3 Tax=Candidatus Yanofskyibacteriota TaxID=1752733 RepID=A0A1F8H3P3_9BACT|nr:MAG: hypothetical protein A2750_01890 [Candidatus Yanofskybacteria bacterium RIFCSPHIGHO2_01_FULL_45_42]OGN15566.1 MAG: hypothetical protein A3C81_00275 [Candidatus Yanofskybacteria bacterium RIFCSPHIGHO2_02_FULL_46_19]OGN27264.1 MAG: hypothetical protein A3B17_00685 [Candidatus Yanofskybacteria bacterium RIFCSPLOWO2_01_FULL_45_72]OGN32202.1 MAG: hypothetical protein A3J01_01265 [Candidatus Yanofskybacteria bacterium RIFCSPLOWO2_02_FULL_45_18]